MYAAPFEYMRAGSWDEAVRRLADEGEEARVIAGGQSLVPLMMLRMSTPSVLVDVNGAGPRDSVVGGAAAQVDQRLTPAERQIRESAGQRSFSNSW